MKELAAGLFAGQDGKATVNVDDLTGKLVAQSGVMIDWPGNSYGFKHLLVNAYLASETLLKADAAALAAAVTNPAWELSLPFAAINLPLTEAFTQRLGSAPDVLYSSLFSLVSWLPDAPPNAAWRAEVFKRLTAA